VLWAALDAPGEAARVRPSSCALRHPSDSGIEWSCRRLRHGETLEALFGERWIDVARFNRIDRRHAVAGVELKVPVLLEDIRDFSPMPREIAESDASAKLIVVDLGEQFLGAYEGSRLVFSAPVATGEDGQPTPSGTFRISALDPAHRSSLYTIEGTSTPYPMRWALRFHISAQEIAFWIHGRDLPGYPASHGCIGLYDEQMQRQYFGEPAHPVLDDAQALYLWVVGGGADRAGFQDVKNGPRVRIIGTTPRIGL
jgi:hypothetical protein